MSLRETLDNVQPLFGDQLYQQRARRTLPLFVRQAWSQNTIYYQQLADELEMPNAHNLNYVLGSIGATLVQHGEVVRSRHARRAFLNASTDE
jgi:hypothetical protein